MRGTNSFSPALRRAASAARSNSASIASVSLHADALEAALSPRRCARATRASADSAESCTSASRTGSPAPRRCRASGATGPHRPTIHCTTKLLTYASRMPNTMLNWNKPGERAAAIRGRDFRDVHRREHRRGADRKAADETEHVERFEVPAERAAERGRDVHEADRLQRVARAVSIARDAGNQRADERAEQARSPRRSRTRSCRPRGETLCAPTS